MAVTSVYNMSCLTVIIHTGCPCNCSWMRGRHSFVQVQAWAVATLGFEGRMVKVEMEHSLNHIYTYSTAM